MGNTLVPGKASEAELSRMMETYGAMLTGTCTVLLGVQETFIRAYKKMDSFRGERPESEKAWLTRIAVNLCRDERRKKWFRFEDRTIPVETMTLSAPEASEEAQQLYAAVQTLPQKYREVILLRFYQDLTAPEIAEILHQATGTIYHKLTRAQEMLKKRLERCDFGG